MRWIASGVIASLCLAIGKSAWADPAPFDLAGPSIELKVTRGGVTLPAAEVPNLAAGDRIWMKADLPAEQTAHYILVASFLRGSTNPPPTTWFMRCDTWASTCSRDGMNFIVPEGAQQMLLFLAPETGGDFKTLVNAVRGRPGAFVRTSQDLNQATLDRSRLEAYLHAIRRLEETDPSALKGAAPLLARSLAIKVDEKCLEKMSILQAACLMQGRESLILSDGHSVSIAQTLTSGPASTLAMDASNTAQLKSGYYGPYIGSLFDIARIFDSFHTAQYQYIPALASAREQSLHLTLNAAPSFHDPKSVIVVALPAIESSRLPPLHPAEPNKSYCARKEPLVLPVEGAPLVFSTQYAHDLSLKVLGKGGLTSELPARPDASRGGVIIDTARLQPVEAAGAVATLHGQWGFDTFEGPTFQLEGAHTQHWTLASGEEANLIIGREATVHLHASSVSCLSAIILKEAAGAEHRVEWQAGKADEVEVRLPLQEVAAGQLMLVIRQHGNEEAQRLELRAFAEASHLEKFELHAHDSQGMLRGARLDQVQRLLLQGVEFVPASLVTHEGRDELTLNAVNARSAAAVLQGETSARVILSDGRVLEVRAVIDAPRPSALLIAKSAERHHTEGNLQIQLGSQDELPQDALLTFSLRAQAPAVFNRDAKIEVATSDAASSVTLDVPSGTMTLQNSRIAVGTLDAARTLGTSAFGPLRFRLVSNGVAGEWRPLATLVRLPLLSGLACPEASGEPCVLSGSNLFLLEAVAGNPHFDRPTAVPDGFTGRLLEVPHPTEGSLYVRLRDDPGVTSEVRLPAAGAASADSKSAPASARGAEALPGNFPPSATPRLH